MAIDEDEDENMPLAELLAKRGLAPAAAGAAPALPAVKPAVPIIPPGAVPKPTGEKVEKAEKVRCLPLCRAR
jgi:hypothetical protein